MNLRTTAAIAKNTFRETIRDRVLYGLIGFAILYILLDLFLVRLALGDTVMMKSFGLAGIYLFALATTIFLGASVMSKEIERRTLYFVLSKPVSRADVILGKFFGLLAAVALTTVLMAVVYQGVVFFESHAFDLLGLLAIGYELLEMGLTIALLVFFSSVASPLTATLSSLCLLFVGHLWSTVLQNAGTMSASALAAARSASYILPNLEKFNFRDLAAHGLVPGGDSLLFGIAYALLYTALLLVLATALFSRREL